MTAPTPEVVDLFSGPRGWDVGARLIGLPDALGVEWDPAACATSRAAGFPTLEADVSALDPSEWGGVRGLIASPPCTMFSRAGGNHGNQAIPLLLDALEQCYRGHDVRAEVRAEMATIVLPGVRLKEQELDAKRAKRGAPVRTPDRLEADAVAKAAHVAFVATLVVEPARWIHALRDTLEWVALEQVPDVRPVWERMHGLLVADGWNVWHDVLNAANYGVAQRRKRALLGAHRTRATKPPPQTHAEVPEADLFGETPRWVTMAEALGWDPDGRVGFPRRDDRGDSPDGYRTCDWHPNDGPAPTLTEKARSWQRQDGERVLLQPGGTGYSDRTNDHAHPDDMEQANRRLYDPETEPAPTVAFGNDAANWRWVDRLNDQSGEGDDGTWMLTQPATVVATRPLVPHPGANANRFNGKAKSRNDGVRVTLIEAALLQSFPATHPWQGNNTKTFQQVGNAIPPLLAAHVLAAITGLPAPGAHPCPNCGHETQHGRWDNCGGCQDCQHLHVTP